jgi:hypothetical protein
MSHPTSLPASTIQRAEPTQPGSTAAHSAKSQTATARTVSPVVRNAIVYPVRVQASPPGFVHDFQI